MAKFKILKLGLLFFDVNLVFLSCWCVLYISYRAIVKLSSLWN